MASYHNFP